MGQERKISLFGKFQWLDNWDIDSEDLTKTVEFAVWKILIGWDIVDRNTDFTKTDKL